MTNMNCSDFYNNKNVNFNNFFSVEVHRVAAANICRGYNLENEYQAFFSWNISVHFLMLVKRHKNEQVIHLHNVFICFRIFFRIFF